MDHGKEHTEFKLYRPLANRIEKAYNQTEGDTFTVLDLGCGKGLYHEDIKDKLSGLGDKDIEVLGLDYDRDLLERNEEENVAQADLAETGIPVEDSSVDFVYSNHLRCQLEKIDNYDFEELEQEAERVLRDGGNQFHNC